MNCLNTNLQRERINLSEGDPKIYSIPEYEDKIEKKIDDLNSEMGRIYEERRVFQDLT